jgi:hypothetical protein
MRKTKLLLLAALLMIAGVAKADVTTTDKVVISFSSLKVEPGSSDVYSFTVSLEGSVKYTAYQVDLQFPEGLEPAYNNKGQLRVSMVKPSLYPYNVEEEENEEGETVEVKSYTHTLSFALNEGNTLRVASISTSNEVFTKTSGDLFKVYVQATPYLKPGDVEIKVKNVKLVTPDETKYLAEDYVSTSVQADATSTLTLKVSAANKFGTCILPFDYELPADASFEAYACSDHTADALLLEKVDKIAAYTPYILYSEVGFSQTISGTVDASKYPVDGIVKSGHLVGVVAQTELTEPNLYVMQNQGQGPMFYQVDPASPFVLAAGKCYVEMPQGTASPSFRIGGTAGIDNEQLTMDNSSVIYNVLGQRVDRMTSGHVYIVNGRKVVK